VAIQLVICLGDLKNLWEKGWFCYSKREYPPHWEIQREILFYNEIWLSHKILSMFYLEHCFLFVQLIELCGKKFMSIGNFKLGDVLACVVFKIGSNISSYCVWGCVSSCFCGKQFHISWGQVW
jgi:hypothetical protein